MRKIAIAIIFFLAVFGALPSHAQFNGCAPGFCGSYPLSTAGCTSASTYIGPGDKQAYAIWAGVRAYSHATCGKPALNVCDSTGGSDVSCADLVTDTTTGLIVAKAMPPPSSITCGAVHNPNCTVKIIYDQTGNNACGGPCNATQNTVANRYYIDSYSSCSGLSATICLYSNVATSGGYTMPGSATFSQPYAIEIIAYTANASALNIFMQVNDTRLYFQTSSSGDIISACDYTSFATTNIYSNVPTDLVSTCVGGVNSLYQQGVVSGNTGSGGATTQAGTPSVLQNSSSPVNFWEYGFINGNPISNIPTIHMAACTFYGYTCGGSGCTAATAWLARTSGLSMTETNAYTTMICGMIADGNGCAAWSGSSGTMDLLYVFATNTTTTANLNLCGTGNTLTQSGTVTFLADNYYQGNGSTGYFDTGLILPSTDFTQNSASLGTYVLNNRTSTSLSYCEIGHPTGIFIAPDNNAGGYEQSLLEVTGDSAAGQTSAQGAWIATRTASNAVAGYKNGSSTPILTGTTASVSFSGSYSIYVSSCRFGAGQTASNWSADQIAATFVGGALTATQAVAINNRINAYMTALGINVYSASCSGYQGAGDIIPSASAGFSVQAWSVATCGSKVANVCVSGVCADMLSSAINGQLVSQNINGTVCPATSTTACVVEKWYDQTASGQCSGSCDLGQYMTNPYMVLTTACPSPITVCLISNSTGTAAINAAAGNITLPVPVTTMVAGAIASTGAGSFNQYFAVSNGAQITADGGAANTVDFSCNAFGTSHSNPTTDGVFHSLLLECDSTTYGIWVNGSAGTSSSWTSASETGFPYAGYTATPSQAVYLVEAGIWKSGASASAAALYTNQHTRFGF
jgi:hypothetical protein